MATTCVTITRSEDGPTRIWCLKCSWRSEADDRNEAWTVACSHSDAEHADLDG